MDSLPYYTTGWGLCIGIANGNYWITDFWLGVSKKVNNIISTSLKILETVIRLRHDNIVVIFQKFAIISHNSAGKSAFNNFDSSF